MVTAAHADSQSAGAALLAVGDQDGQVEDGLAPLRPASAAGQDPRRVVWGQTAVRVSRYNRQEVEAWCLTQLGGVLMELPWLSFRVKLGLLVASGAKL